MVTELVVCGFVLYYFIVKLTMFAKLVCGFVLYRIVMWIFFDDDAQSDLDSSRFDDLDSSRFDALFAVAKRLEKLYVGSKVYVGLQIPDPDSASRKNIDLVLVTNQEAIVISVKNVSGFVSIDRNNNWVCSDSRNQSILCLPDPVAETKNLVSVLEGYLEQRGVSLPEGYLSYKVICPNPNFCQSDLFPPEVITYGQWTELKPKKSSYSGSIKGTLFCGNKKMQESFSEKLNSVLCTAPTWDRLELKGNKCILGEFLEFKGKPDDLQVLRKIKRSKVSKTRIYAFDHSDVQVRYAMRDYRVEGPSWSSQWQEATVRSNTELVFCPQNSTKLCKYKLSSISSVSLSV